MAWQWWKMEGVVTGGQYNTHQVRHEPPHDKTNKMASAPSEDSDQPGHLCSMGS